VRAAPRDKLITFQRPVTATNDYNEPVRQGPPTTIASAFARVRYGTGQERREAAQKAATQVATFECLMSPTLGAVLMTDEILFEGAIWDISSSVTVGRDQIHFTAMRAKS